jgi:adenylate cyclase class IV
MQNIEFKAELRDLAAARKQCERLGARRIGLLEQIDTYFRLADGRLKRREARGEPTEWIHYHRSDDVSPRLSNYSILTDDQARRRWGTHSLREWLVVRKQRELWMLDNVRIHLDIVEKLGTFIELEAVVSASHAPRDCRKQVDELRNTFGPILGEAVAASYSDLMELEIAQPPGA